MPEEKHRTGYPSIDKPWLKYYSKEAINAPLPKCTIYEYLYENNKDYPNDIALIYFDRKITYREMFESIDRVARSFASIGVKENDVVTLLMLNQPETVYCLYALSKLGAVTCVINVLSSEQEIEHYLAEAKSKYFVALDLFFEKSYDAAKNYGVEKFIYVPLFESRDILHRTLYRMKVRTPEAVDAFVQSWRDFVNGATSAVLPKVTRKSSACSVIGHSGGTTGTPKGIMLSDDACNSVAAQQIELFNHSRQDSMLNTIVPFAIYGLLDNLHVPLSFGMKTILIPKVDPDSVDKLIIKYKPNYIASIPMYWKSVISSKRLNDLSFLKMAAAGGSGLSHEMATQLNLVLKKCNAGTETLSGYGLSEVGSVACAQMNGNTVPHSVGFPLPKNIVAAFDVETANKLPYNEVGEICINSPSTMLGYLENEEETKNALRVHDDGLVWMHTGDLGYVDEDGNVFIKGRLKRIYLTEYNGALAKIFPDRIEQTLQQSELLSDCGVVCVQSSGGVYQPVAFCVLKSGYRKDTEEAENELHELSQKELPEYDLPVRYIFKDELPRTAHGKIDYRALEEIVMGI